jgi:peptidoglycan hydrolase-like protein with peptidoglycan-binding domain
MEKQDMPNAMDEIRKLQEALKKEGDGSGSADGIMPKKTKDKGRRFKKTNGIKPNRKPNE